MTDDRTPRPDETPTERLLREGLNARAMQVTQHSLRPATPPATRIRRLRPVLSVAVPLFGLAAGLIGYVTIDTRTTAAHRDPAPAASVSTTSTLAPDPVSDPSPSASAVDYRDGAVAVKIDGLGNGASTNAGAPVPFTVTWSNTTQVRLENVLPNVIGPNLCQTGGTAKLQRNDGGTWTDVPSGQQSAPVSLDPGAKLTTQYRVQVTGAASAGTLSIDAMAQLPVGPGGGAPNILGQATAPLSLTLDHQLTVAVVSGPGDFHPGGSKSQLVLKVTNPTGGPMTAVAPAVSLNAFTVAGEPLQADRLTVEAEVGDGWQALDAKADPCGPRGTLDVDTSSLAQALPAGGSTQFTLRFGYNLESRFDTGQWKSLISYQAGATAAGQSAATVQATGYMTHWPGDMTPPSAPGTAPSASPSPSPSADPAPSGSPTH